jgi:hypothetical protein
VIAGSLLLILVAVVLLAVGLVQGSNPYLVGSIVASLLAAIALIVGSKRPRPVPPAEPVEEDAELIGRRVRTRLEPSIPAQGAAPDTDRGRTGQQSAADDDEFDDEDPPDEPGAQHVLPADSARVAELSTDVLVVDGRPRYHISGCVHLLGRDSEPLPVGEAIGLGFTPCGLCEPDSALLAEARRV